MARLDDSTPQTRRPHANLLKYYIAESLLLGPLFWIILIPRYLRYRTLHYRWDDQGITASWGALFHREISLDFERIQDIHLSSNLVERWLGLAKVQVQTASGSSKAEMTIEGLQDYQEIRDFLYSRMRGVREAHAPGATTAGATSGSAGVTERSGTGEAASGAVVRALEATAAELRALRIELAAQRRGQAPHLEHTGRERADS